MNSFLFQGLNIVWKYSNTGNVRIFKVVLPCGETIRGHRPCMGFLRLFTGIPNLTIPNIELSPVQQEIIIGGLLGDLAITRAKPTHNSRLAVRHSTNQTLYAEFLFSWNISSMDPLWVQGLAALVAMAKVATAA